MARLDWRKALAFGLILGLAVAHGVALAQQDESSSAPVVGTDERAALLERWDELLSRRQQLLQELAELSEEMKTTARELWPERFERAPRDFRERARMSPRFFGPRGHRMFAPGAGPWHWDYSCPVEEPQEG